MGKTTLDLKRLREDGNLAKAGLLKEKEAVRELGETVKGIANDLSATNTVAGIVEQRLSETASGLKTARNSVDDLNTVTLKLHEDHENTKITCAEALAGLKKVGLRVKQIDESLEKTGNALVGTQNKLDAARHDVSSLQNDLIATKTNVCQLKDGGNRAEDNLHRLRRHLNEVEATTQAVRAGLKEQSSILLPNINMDSHEARTATGRHGSLLCSISNGIPTSPGRTSRPAASLEKTLKPKGHAAKDDSPVTRIASWT